MWMYENVKSAMKKLKKILNNLFIIDNFCNMVGTFSVKFTLYLHDYISQGIFTKKCNFIAHNMFYSYVQIGNNLIFLN